MLEGEISWQMGSLVPMFLKSGFGVFRFKPTCKTGQKGEGTSQQVDEVLCGGGHSVTGAVGYLSDETLLNFCDPFWTPGANGNFKTPAKIGPSGVVRKIPLTAMANG